MVLEFLEFLLVNVDSSSSSAAAFLAVFLVGPKATKRLSSSLISIYSSLMHAYSPAKIVTMIMTALTVIHLRDKLLRPE